ncbi:hypothetical protein [Deinococcus peraridilitoris]|uniref:Uncharacterized protein n=1 Tax=Deinococcus peraridilitoris (strain DSM 19664 / LMG 22246 / CIP 109416 / KR-200) TaxID=937777 RepID=L0A317_DEIPD|nr:hypothetical protein [Deinococcus peraridilitoris]AFZ67572.1 hypothetical protein Deipe_2076 [Deinococcus peraridilitoris DSM 19664]
MNNKFNAPPPRVLPTVEPQPEPEEAAEELSGLVFGAPVPHGKQVTVSAQYRGAAYHVTADTEEQAQATIREYLKAQEE